MIDIHSHILPMVDDGSDSIFMSLEMLSMAYEDGSDAIILTPHFARAYDFDNHKYKIRQLFEQFKQIVNDEKIPIDIYLGCEYLFINKEIFELELHEIETLNDTNYILTEFYFDVDENVIYDAIEIISKKGYIPILAHPERYDCIQNNVEIALKACSLGAKLQLNKGSISGRYGQTAKETSIELLNHKAYFFIGSDAHHPNRRSPLLSKSYDYIKEHFGVNYANDLYYNNPNEYLIKRKESYYGND